MPDQPETPPVPNRTQQALLIGLLLTHVVLLAFAAWWHAPTQNEVGHLPAGLAIWRFGRFDLYRVNPPLVRSVSALPVLWVAHEEDWTHAATRSPRRVEWQVGSDLIVANGEKSLWLMTLARFACLPFSLWGLWMCWHIGRQVFGNAAGIIAATLWCFSPNIIGHGSLITPDIAATALGLTASWSFGCWLARPSWRNALAAGFCLGLALLAKLYWIILLGLWPALAIWFRWRHGDSQNWKLDRWLQLIALLGIGLNLLNLGYGFQGTGTRLGGFDFYSQTLSGAHRDLDWQAGGNRFRGSIWGAIPVPLPRDYVTGIDLQKHDLEEENWSYLLGKAGNQGWWYYYLVGLGVKVPLGTWCLVVLGGYGLWKWPLCEEHRTRLAPAFLSSAALLVLVSSQTGLNQHVRYAFPVLPILFLIAGASWKVRHHLALAGLLASIMGSLLVFPHSLSYFNSLTGGPRNGHTVLIHSNVDWGQDLTLVRRWIENHPDCQPVTLAWVPGYPSEAIGLKVARTPPGRVTPGWHVISVHLLHDAKSSYAAYQNLQPVDRVGFSFNVYHVETD